MLGCTDDVSAEYISARSGDMSVQVNSTMTVRQTIAVAQVIPSTVIPKVRDADGCSHRMRFYGFPMRNCSASYAGTTF